MSRTRFLVVVLVLGALAAGGCSKDSQVAKQEFVKRGDAFMAEKKYAEAIIVYQNAVQLDDRFGEARAKLARAYLITGEGAKAYYQAVRAADLLPKDASAQLVAGSMDVAAGRYDDALSRADKILALQPNSVEGNTLRGHALAGLKDFNSAIAQFEDAIRLDPTRSLTYSDLGMVQSIHGDAVKAEKAFRDAINLAPKSVPPRLALANFAWAQGKHDVAEQILKEALALEPRHVVVNRALAFLYVSTGRMSDAEAPLKLIADETKDASARVLLAQYYRTTGRQSLALQTLDALAEDPATFGLARARKADLLYSDGRKQEAYATLEEALHRNAKDSIVLIQKAQFLFADGDLDQALALARTAAAGSPSMIGPQFVVGKIQAKRGEFDDAIATYNGVLKLAPKFLPAHLELGRVNLLAERPKEALQSAEAALALQPLSADAILMKANALMAQGNLSAAEAPMRLLAAKFPGSPVVQAQLGTLSLQKRDMPAARAAFEAALKGNPSNVEALTGLATVDVVEKKGPAARARIEAAVAKHPESTPLLIVAARTYGAIGDTAQAERTLRRIIELDPANLDAYVWLGRMFASQHRLPEAIAEFQTLAKLKPKAVGPPTQIGIFLDLQNKRAEAAKWYQQALGINKQAGVAANNLAMYYVDTGGSLDVALQLAQTAKAQMPDQPEVNDTLGWIYTKKNLGTLALGPLQQAVGKDPNNPIYQYHLGLAYAAAGNVTRARAALQRALSINPTFDGAADAKAALAKLQR